MDENKQGNEHYPTIEGNINITIKGISYSAVILWFSVYSYGSDSMPADDKEVTGLDTKLVEMNTKLTRMQHEIDGIKSSVTALVVKDNLSFIEEKIK